MNFYKSYKKLGYCIDGMQNIEAKFHTKTKYKMLDDNVDNYFFSCSSLTGFKAPANLPEEELLARLKRAVEIDVLSYYDINASKQMLDSAIKAGFENAKSMCYFAKQTANEVFVIYEDGRAFVCDKIEYKDSEKQNIAKQDCFKFSCNNYKLDKYHYQIKTDITSYEEDKKVTLSTSLQYIDKTKIYHSETFNMKDLKEDLERTTEERVSCSNGVNVDYKKTVIFNNNLEEHVELSTKKSKSQEISFDMFENAQDDLSMDC